MRHKEVFSVRQPANINEFKFRHVETPPGGKELFDVAAGVGTGVVVATGSGAGRGGASGACGAGARGSTKLAFRVSCQDDEVLGFLTILRESYSLLVAGFSMANVRLLEGDLCKARSQLLREGDATSRKNSGGAYKRRALLLRCQCEKVQEAPL